MKMLVTGAAGFIGRALVARLLKDGHQVRVAVRKPSGLPDEILVGELSTDTDWTLALHECEAVVHLASRVHIMRDDAADPAAAFHRVNVAGTLQLARQAAAMGVRRFVFASSIKVHGEGRETAYRETDAPAPEDDYAASKWEAEQQLRALAAATGMTVVVLRIPLVYGPGVKANFLQLIRAVDNGMPLPFGRIDNRRSLIFLGNLVDALVLSLQSPAAANRTYLVSDGEDVSTPELIRRLAAALGRPARLWPVPVALMELVGFLTGHRNKVRRLWNSLTLDGRAIRDELGWSPPFTMQAGLKLTADWYRKSEAAHHD